MTAESNNNESTPPEKLLIDNPSDFQFHAAYLTYSDTYDKTDPEIKKRLNQNITALQQNQIDYPTFYKNINQYRAEASPEHRYRRTRIKARENENGAKKQKNEKETSDTKNNQNDSLGFSSTVCTISLNKAARQLIEHARIRIL
jgi:hypothetical protein